jgi:hypothetical protein
MDNILIGLDCGNCQTGICVVSDGKIVYAANVLNEDVIDNIEQQLHLGKLTVVIEDIKPYSVSLGQSTIDTIKFIGELQYRLRESKIDYVLVPRYDVKKWCFDNFPEIVLPRIEKKILCSEKRENKKTEEGKKGKNYRTKEGELKTPTAIYCDDRIIIAVMKKYWNIPEAKVGKSNIYSLKEHSWQALGAVTTFINSK